MLSLDQSYTNMTCTRAGQQQAPPALIQVHSEKNLRSYKEYAPDTRLGGYTLRLCLANAAPAKAATTIREPMTMMAMMPPRRMLVWHHLPKW